MYQPRDSKLAQVTEKWYALGKEADHLDGLFLLPAGDTGTSITVSLFDPVHAPGTRTAYYTTGEDVWSHGAMTSFPFAAYMGDQDRTYQAGERRSEEWYRGLL